MRLDHPDYEAARRRYAGAMKYGRGWLVGSLCCGLIGCASVRVEDGGSESNDVNDPPVALPESWTSSCPAPSELVAVDPSALGSCSNAPLEGELTERNAEDILYLLVHEAGHLSGLALGEDGGLFEWTDSGSFQAQTDDGYAVGAFSGAEPEDGEGMCAVLEFGCWTGGHGGWGPAALAGVAFVEVTSEAGLLTRLRIASESIWLAESGPLEGTPRTPVSVDVSLVDGQIAGLFADIGGYSIER